MAAPTSKVPVEVIFGAMTIGKAGREPIRVSDPAVVSDLLDTFRSHGHTIIDSARIYGGGSTDDYLGDAKYADKGLQVDAKLAPNRRPNFFTDESWSHEPASVAAGLQASLDSFKNSKCRAFYLHSPDRAVPYEDTLRAVNELYKQGKFEVFGISKYYSWEVAQICEICKKNGWVMPTVYQGAYNAYTRVIEPELMPCLRHYGISFFAFNPMAGGFLTGRYKREAPEEVEEGGRFDKTKILGQLHHKLYWNEPMFEALDILRPVADKHGLSIGECALRWLAHHSALKGEHGDGVILGASSVHHLEENLLALEKGPLPADVVEAIEAGGEKAKAMPQQYWG